MSSEQKFDKLFRNKTEGGENDFPFDEAAWENARKMIDAERGAGMLTVKNVSLAIAFILLLGLGTFVTLNLTGGNKQVAGTTISPSAQIEETANGKISVNSINGTSEIYTTIEDRTITPDQNSSSGKKDHTSGQVNISPANNLRDAASHDKVLSENAALMKKKNNFTGGSMHNSSKNNTGAKARKSKVSPLPQDETKENLTPNADYVVYENHENAFWLAGKITSLPSNKLDSALIKTPFDFIRVYDVDYYKAKRRKTHYVNLEAGMAYLLGWNAPKGKDAKGFNAFAGINAGVYLGKKSSLSAGVQFYNIGNIQQPFFNGSNVSYDFGANGTYTVLSGKSLYYTAIPINFNYSFKGSDRVSVGVNTGILCGGVNTEETFVMQDGIKLNHQVNRSAGFYEGMNPVNIMVTAGYGRNLSKRFRMNAEFLYGLSDIYKSTKLNQTKERIPGIRIGMQYTIADK